MIGGRRSGGWSRAGRLLGVLLGLQCALLPAGAVPPDGTGTRLVVASKPNAPPFEYTGTDGALDGYCVEVLRELARLEGLDLEFRALRNHEVWAAFDAGTVDVVSAAVYSEARTRRMEFSIPLAQVGYGLVVRAEGPGIRSERDLAGREVIVVQRSPMEAYAQGAGHRQRLAQDYEACLLDLARGAGDAALVPRVTWLHFSKRPEFRGLRMVPTEIYPYRMCLAVRKGDSLLLAKLNEGLFRLKERGDLDRIYEKHLGSLERTDLTLASAFRKLAGWILPALLVVGFLVHLAWTFVLRRLVKRRTADLQAELERRQETEAELARNLGALQAALAEVKQLSGLLPICAGCKKIRDERGGWQPVERYISENTEATFSHGMCPDCLAAYYPDFKPGNGAPAS
ncbi:MAG: transporter substrate-binding domain-containing protein [Acidobacteria bacterium]|nr:transporter substrate-binding domain-containing protein [Acidobacteriota bacterium]